MSIFWIAIWFTVAVGLALTVCARGLALVMPIQAARHVGCRMNIGGIVALFLGLISCKHALAFAQIGEAAGRRVTLWVIAAAVALPFDAPHALAATATPSMAAAGLWVTKGPHDPDGCAVQIARQGDPVGAVRAPPSSTAARTRIQPARKTSSPAAILLPFEPEPRTGRTLLEVERDVAPPTWDRSVPELRGTERPGGDGRHPRLHRRVALVSALDCQVPRARA